MISDCYKVVFCHKISSGHETFYAKSSPMKCWLLRQNRDNFVHAPSQWESTLYCNADSNDQAIIQAIVNNLNGFCRDNKYFEYRFSAMYPNSIAIGLDPVALLRMRVKQFVSQRLMQWDRGHLFSPASLG